ncbi:MAG TPA: TetR/AcrR family transcriptional regulator [Kofleriaceae bacterium]|nr:TetR/AcrR family transcriptional regulator [Kofleriaceae bacterium]
MTPRARNPEPSRAATDKAADKREAILAAALELFVERGFHGTAVPEVAARAGVGAGTIYRYFESKEALVNELYRRNKQLVLGRVVKDFPAGASAREQFGALWRGLARFADDEPQAFAFLELHNHSSYLDAESKAIEDRIIQFGIGFVEAAQRRGEVRLEHPAILIGIVMGALIGLVSKGQQCGLAMTPERWAIAEQCVWEAIRI